MKYEMRRKSVVIWPSLCDPKTKLLRDRLVPARRASKVASVSHVRSRSRNQLDLFSFGFEITPHTKENLRQ
jgi:hypothetical protein